MSQPFVGELRLVGFSFQPVGWNFCNGALIAISQNEALYNLIGTFYGGDGINTFGLPDLRGRTPIHQGTGPGGPLFIIGQIAGSESVTLTIQQMPSHNHAFMANSAPTAANTNVPSNNTLTNGLEIYEKRTATAPMGAMVAASGGSQPHNNLQPYLVLNWIIAMEGVYPTQS